MKFLCLRHHQMFAKLSLNEQNNLWMLWMENAVTFCEKNNTEQMLAATGSAFDLACLARTEHPDCMQVELTLSAILVCRTLRDHGDHAAADSVLFGAIESLQSAEPCYGSPSGWCSTDECIEVLLDPSRQPEFVTEYLNWPSFSSAYSVSQPLAVAH
ncbi:hypothetical protein [Marinobacter sp.]|uniref:hypothetical protein n=1 Tax=Marinobacter sp. TaxID=50741 RepID=UPI0035619E3E